MVNLRVTHVHVKIVYLLRSLMCTFYISCILSQTVEIIHGEALSDFTSTNHGRNLNRLPRQNSRTEIARCITAGSLIKSLNLSQFEINSVDSPMRKKLTDVVLKKLFEKYGQNEGQLSIKGLENLLTNIGLVGQQSACENSNLISQQLHSSVNFASSNDRKRSDSDRWADRARSRHHRRLTNSRSVEDLVLNSESDANVPSASDVLDDGNSGNAGRDWNSDVTPKCLDAQNFLDAHGIHSERLQPDDLLAICPLMILVLDSTNCSGRTSDRNLRRSTRDVHSEEECVRLGCGPTLSHVQATDGDADHVHHENNTTKQITPLTQASVWGYAIASCAVISAVGLVAVGIIPLMHKVIYNHLLQFLVALAIGSLTGDALLHLLPHALVPHSHKPQTSSKETNDTASNHHDDHLDREENVIWLGLTAVGGIFLFFIVERLVGLYSDWRRHSHDHADKPNTLDTLDELPTTALANPQIDDMKKVGIKLATHEGVQSCEEKLMMVHSSKGVQKLAHEAHEEMHRNCDPGTSEDLTSWDHSRNTRGHQHSHSVPGSVASVAWMVIIGDGFHNFADGIAVGSAFASGFSDGLSTSVAVFCHELPHELGDFAMLLNAGMSAKQALIYNCVSSILCFVGMACGVAVGNIASSSQWIFAIVAGMFLYIALVDMLPEMKSVDPKKGENPLVHLGLQSAGMLLGIGVMLVIALFEGKILV